MNNPRKYDGNGSSEIGKQKAKRRVGRRETYTRFSTQEQEMLLDGIRKFGAGNWKRILCAYKFHEKRTAVDLKDKYRNILRAEERERSYGMRGNSCNKVSCKRKPMTAVGFEGISEQGLVRPGRLNSGEVNNEDGWERVVTLYGWERRMKGPVSEFGSRWNGGNVRVSRCKEAGEEMASPEIGERIEVCRPPAAMRLERLLCPAD